MINKCTLYSSASKPLHTNSNKVFKFSGLGAVTKILEYLFKEMSLQQCTSKLKQVQIKKTETDYIYYPAAIAPAIANPRAADFPRPRAANKAIVFRSVLSKIASRNVITALPYKKTVSGL